MVPMPDNYMSMQKGVIDGMGAPWEAIHGFRLSILFTIIGGYTEILRIVLLASFAQRALLLFAYLNNRNRIPIRSE